MMADAALPHEPHKARTLAKPDAPQGISASTSASMRVLKLSTRAIPSTSSRTLQRGFVASRWISATIETTRVDSSALEQSRARGLRGNAAGAT